MATYGNKVESLTARRTEYLQQHRTLSEQVAQLTVAINQIDGALAILKEIHDEEAAVAEHHAETNGATKLPAG